MTEDSKVTQAMIGASAAERAAKEPELRAAPTSRRQQAGKRSSEELKDQIGRQLRSVYDDVLRQPIPDRLNELIRQLKVKEGE